MVTIKVSKQLQDYIDKCHTPDGHAIGTVYDLQQFSKSRKELTKVVDTLQEQLALHAKMLDEYNQLTVKQMQYDMSTIDDILPIWMVVAIVESTPLENYYKSGDKYTDVVKRFRDDNSLFNYVKARQYTIHHHLRWESCATMIDSNLTHKQVDDIICLIAEHRQYSYDLIIFDPNRKTCVHYLDDELLVISSNERSVEIQVNAIIHCNYRGHLDLTFDRLHTLFKLKQN